MHRKPKYLKILTASAENNAVDVDELALSGQHNINESPPLKQGIEHGDQGAVMVVPSQTELTSHADNNSSYNLQSGKMFFSKWNKDLTWI